MSQQIPDADKVARQEFCTEILHRIESEETNHPGERNESTVESGL